MRIIYLRVPDDLHAVAMVAAAAQGKPLAHWAMDAMRGAILVQARKNEVVAMAIERQAKNGGKGK